MKFIYSFTIVCIASVAIVQANDQSYLGDVKSIFKTYQECASEDLSTCLKSKLYTVMDRIARSSNDFKVYEGVTFEKDEGAASEDEQSKTESEIEASLPRSLDDKEQTLNQMIMDKVFSFFDSHTLKVSRKKYFKKASELEKKSL